MNEASNGNGEDRIGRTRGWLREHMSLAPDELVRRSAEMGRSRPRVFVTEVFVFVRELVREFFRVEGLTRAASLAHATLLALVPLLVVVTSALRGSLNRVMPDVDMQIDQIINLVFPYKAPQIAYHIRQFVENAKAASAFGGLAFLVVSFHLFAEMQTTFNEIWRVEGARGLRQKVRAFAMLVFWGPVVIGVSLTTSAAMQRSPQLRLLLDRTAVPAIVPAIILFAAFAMLFWLIPATKVQFRSAMLGAAVTTIFFELIRFGFGAYAGSLFAGRLNLIYGALGLVILFFVVVELLWIVILIGAEVSHVHQHLEGILRAEAQQIEEREEWDLYFAIRLMIELSRRFMLGESYPAAARLARAVRATDEQAERVLGALERAELVQRLDDEGEYYLPAQDPDVIFLRDVVCALHGRWASPARRTDDPAERLVCELLGDLGQRESEVLSNLTVGGLVRDVYGVQIAG